MLILFSTSLNQAMVMTKKLLICSKLKQTYPISVLFVINLEQKRICLSSFQSYADQKQIHRIINSVKESIIGRARAAAFIKLITHPNKIFTDLCDYHNTLFIVDVICEYTIKWDCASVRRKLSLHESKHLGKFNKILYSQFV